MAAKRATATGKGEAECGLLLSDEEFSDYYDHFFKQGGGRCLGDQSMWGIEERLRLWTERGQLGNGSSACSQPVVVESSLARVSGVQRSG